MDPSLISRLEAAEGGSRELSALAVCEANGWKFEGWTNDNRQLQFIFRREDGSRVLSLFDDNSAVTESLDAIVALIERELPGWCCSAINIVPPPCEAYVWQPKDHRTRAQQGKGATPALALCIAFLKAKALTPSTVGGGGDSPSGAELPSSQGGSDPIADRSAGGEG